MPRPLRTAWISACLVVTLVSCAPKAAPPPPPTAVKVAKVLVQDVPVYLEAIGEARGNTEIEIRARVTGYLETVEFREGSMVTRGQRLYTLDRAPFEAKLAQARGQLAEAEAQLARARQDIEAARRAEPPEAERRQRAKQPPVPKPAHVNPVNPEAT